MTTAIAHTSYMTVRHLRELWRQPWWILISLAQPLVYLLIYSALFEKVAEIPGFTGGSYVDFFAPGIVVVTALFSGGWTGMGIIDDLDRGVLDRFLVSPVSRGSLIGGRLGQQAVTTVIQSLIIVGLALALGASFPGGAGGVTLLVVAAVFLSTGFGALSIGLALVMRQRESVIGAVQLLLLPLTFLSTAFMERALMPGWIQDVSRFNPVDWAVTAGREAVSASPDWSTVLSYGSYMLAFGLISAWLAATAFRAYQRSV
jgi:ABC-2 type transport system permease protein